MNKKFCASSIPAHINIPIDFTQGRAGRYLLVFAFPAVIMVQTPW
jgi:hypothetical protein